MASNHGSAVPHVTLLCWPYRRCNKGGEVTTDIVLDSLHMLLLRKGLKLCLRSGRTKTQIARTIKYFSDIIISHFDSEENPAM